jgi:hypothetical protein
MSLDIRTKIAKLSTNSSSGIPLESALLYDLGFENGHVFCVYRIDGTTSAKKQDIAIALHDQLDRFRQSVNEKANIARRFEHLIQSINDQLKPILSDIHTVSLKQIHISIGVTSQNNLFLTGFGEVQAEYLHKTGNQRYTLYELHKQFDVPEEANPEKLLVTILDGELNPGDVFLVTSNLCSNIEASDKQDILVTLPPKSALQRLEQHLGAQEEMSAIAISIYKHIESGRKKINPFSSLKQLDDKQKETNTMLGDDAPNVKVAVENFIENQVRKLARPGERDAKSIFYSLLRLFLRFLLFTFRGLYRLSITLLALTKNIFLEIKNNKRLPKPSTIIKPLIAKKKSRIIVSIVAIVLLVTIVTGGLILVRNRRIARQNAEYTEVYTEIERDLDSASTSLIYNDTERARSLIESAFTKLDTVPENGATSARRDELNTELLSVLNDLRKAVPVVPAPLLEGASITHIAKNEVGDIIGVSSNGSFHTYNPLSNTFEQSGSAESIAPIDALVSSTNSYYAITEGGDLARIEGENVSAITSGISGATPVTNIELYNGNIYSVIAGNEQIIRYRPQANGFDAGTPWITNRISELSNARDIAIDGEIYLLTANDVVRFLAGREQSFDIATIDPPLTSADHIFTTPNSDYIHVLEPTSRRIIVFDKTGNLIQQYTSDELSSATEFIVDEERRVILFSSDTGIYEFEAIHLNR